jgi:DNA-binding XRE family transcriptional regulator
MRQIAADEAQGSLSTRVDLRHAGPYECDTTVRAYALDQRQCRVVSSRAEPTGVASARRNVRLHDDEGALPFRPHWHRSVSLRALCRFWHRSGGHGSLGAPARLPLSRSRCPPAHSDGPLAQLAAEDPAVAEVCRALSQEALGDRARLHRHQIGAIERGEHNPTFHVLLKVQRGLATPLSELMKTYESV